MKTILFQKMKTNVQIQTATFATKAPAVEALSERKALAASTVAVDEAEASVDVTSACWWA